MTGHPQADAERREQEEEDRLEELTNPLTYPLRHEQQQAIYRALGRMPYATGLIGGSMLNPGPHNVEELVAFLDRLTERLADVSEQHRTTADQLARLEAQRRAIRAFLGTSTGLE